VGRKTTTKSINHFILKKEEKGVRVLSVFGFILDRFIAIGSVLAFLLRFLLYIRPLSVQFITLGSLVQIIAIINNNNNNV